MPGKWYLVQMGYTTEVRAKGAVAWHAKGDGVARRWRLVCDDGRIIESNVVPGKRAAWTVTQETHK